MISEKSIIDSSHSKSADDVLSTLKVDPETGLNETTVIDHLHKFGPNVIETKEKKGWLIVLAGQFKSLVIWVLFAAALISLFFNEWMNGIAIGIVIIINALIGFIMEWQAIKSMTALKKLSVAEAVVIRDGSEIKINSEEVVPGDIIIVQTGDIVAADARLINQNNLQLKESALTGESIPVDKIIEATEESVQIGDQRNMLFKGTIVTRGNGKAVVVATGMSTQLGSISKMAIEAEKEATPLEKKLNKLTKRLIILTLLIAVLVALSGILKGRDLVLMIETAIALAVAAIPEGLPIVATIALARGMLRLSRKNVIVKSLEAVQTLGEINVICTDKTGTLTEDNMQVTNIILPGSELKIDQLKDNKENISLQKIIQVSILCNNAHLDKENHSEATIGDPVEIGLLFMSEAAGKNIDNVKDQYKRLKEVPFEAETKMMATLHKDNGKYFAAVKGALEVILKNCSYVLQDEEVKKLVDHKEWISKADELANGGLRILAFAYNEYDSEPEDYTHDLIFLGIICFLDPPRKDVKPAIELCREAGIKVVMVTGDHPETAKNIAQQTGITTYQKARVIHGNDIKAGTGNNDDLVTGLMDIDVFARVNPGQKLDLVGLYQKSGLIVAMTGDGVNDAPALKKADIGIAMGIRGTEAARETADLILKDDAFTSILTAMKQGRVIFKNIRNFVVYLLSCNISEILIVATASFAFLPLPLLPLQILFLNIVTDVFPALALGMGRGEAEIMKNPPRKSEDPIITKKLWVAIVAYGLSITVAIIGLVFYAKNSLNLSNIEINNLAFYTIILAQLWNVLNLSSLKSSFFINEITRNIHVWLAITLCVLIAIVAYYIAPVRIALSLQTAHTDYIWLIILFSLLPVLIVQIFKRGFKIIY